jgi:hypothetical protein
VRTVSEEAMAERLQAGDATRWILRELSLDQIACVLRGALTGFRQARLDERLGAHFGRGCIDDVDREASETALNHPHELSRRKSLTVEIEEWLAHLPSVSGECQANFHLGIHHNWEKTKFHLEAAAMTENEVARNNLGEIEFDQF